MLASEGPVNEENVPFLPLLKKRSSANSPKKRGSVSGSLRNCACEAAKRAPAASRHVTFQGAALADGPDLLNVPLPGHMTFL